jgi:hypothetical protein
MRWIIPLLLTGGVAHAGPGKLTELVVTHDGKRVALQSAIAVDEGNGRIELTLTNFPYTCKERFAGFRNSYPNEVEVKLFINPRLAKDGTLGWGIRGTHFGNISGTKQSGTDPIPSAAIDAADGKTSKLTLDVKEEGPGDKPETLTMKGKVEVLGCGADPSRKAETPLAPQKGAFLEIAGKQLPIAGAAYGKGNSKDERELILSTGPAACIKGTERGNSHFPDVSVTLSWDKGKLVRAVIDGTMVEGWGVRQQADIALTATPNAPPAGAKDMAVALGGSTTISGYNVALKGNVKAVVCLGK